MNDEKEFLGGRPPVIVTANGCSGTVTVNIRYVFEQREHDTLRRWAARLLEEAKARQLGQIGISVLLMAGG